MLEVTRTVYWGEFIGDNSSLSKKEVSEYHPADHDMISQDNMKTSCKSTRVSLPALPRPRSFLNWGEICQARRGYSLMRYR